MGWLEKNLVPRPDLQALPETDKVAALNGFAQMGKAKTGGGPANAEGFADLPYADKRNRLEDHFNTHIADGDFFDLDYDEQDRIRANYVRMKTGADPAPAPAPIEEDPSVVKDFGKGLAGGTLNLPESAGTVIQYAGQRIKGEDRSAEFAADPNHAFARMLPGQRDDVARKMEEYQKIIPRDQAFKKAVGEVFEVDAAKRARVGRDFLCNNFSYQFEPLKSSYFAATPIISISFP